MGASNTFTLASTSYDSKSLDVSAVENFIQDIKVSPDGTKLYFTGTGTSQIHQYTMSTAGDITTATADSVTLTVSGTMTSFAFSEDGTKVYVLTVSGFDKIHQYELATAWDLATTTNPTISYQLPDNTDQGGVGISPNGARLYTLSTSNLTEYVLSTPYSIGTAGNLQYYSTSSDNAVNLTQGTFIGVDTFLGFDWNDNLVYHWNLATDYSITTASLVSSFDVSNEIASGGAAVCANADGSAIYVATAAGVIYQYSTGSALTGQPSEEGGGGQPPAPSSGTYEEYVTSLSPTAWYKLDETSGTTAADSSGNGYNGTYTNSPTLGQTSLIASDPTGKSVSFDGVSQYTNLNSTATELLTHTTGTVCFFAKAPTNGQVSLNIGTSTEDLHYIVFELHAGNPSIQFFCRVNGAAAGVDSFGQRSSFIPSADTTYHIAFVKDAVGVRIYVNGVDEGVTTWYGTPSSKWFSDFGTPAFDNVSVNSLQRDTVFEYDEGTMDDLQIYDRALSASEIINIYNKATDATNLTYDQYINYLSPVAYWKLDDNLPEVSASTYNNDFSASGGLSSSLYEQTVYGSPTNLSSNSDGSTFTTSFLGSGQIVSVVDRSYFGIVGNFDFQIDLNSLTRDAGAGSSYFWIGVGELGSSTHLVRVGVYKDDSSSKFYIRHGSTFVWPSWGGTNARLRIQRVGSTYNMYYENGIGASWTPAASPTISSNPVYIELYAYHNTTVNGAAYSVNIDNLVFNSGTTRHLLAKEEITGGGYSGTYVNSPTLGQGSLIASDTTGKSVLYTESSNNYTTLPYLSDVLATDMSFSLYFNATALDSAWQTILHLGDNLTDGEQGFTVGLDASNQLSFYWFNGSFRTVAWGEISLSANTTYHLVITVDSTNSEVKAYVDGTLVATKAMPAALILPPSAGGFIGANRSSVELFDGRVDDVSFYSRVLTSTEILTLYSKAINGGGVTASPHYIGTALGNLGITVIHIKPSDIVSTVNLSSSWSG